MKRRIFSFFLALVMAVSSVPQAVFAAEACSHHMEHTSECGYQAAIPATPCSHSCTEGSGCSPSEAVCIHTAHDDACGYAEEIPEQPCSFQCTICAGLCEHSLDPDVCNDCNPPTTIVSSVGTVTVPSDEGLTKAEHSFAGWNTAPASSGEALTSETVHTSDTVNYANWQQTHTHQEEHCGGACEFTQPLTLADIEGYDYSLPSGSYYLEEDLSLAQTLYIGGNVSLCLNGHNIVGTSYSKDLMEVSTLTLYECNTVPGKLTAGRNAVRCNVAFTMNGGNITENANVGVSAGSGVFVLNAGTVSKNGEMGVNVSNSFIMNGGEIRENNSRGVYAGAGTVVLNGGRITQNAGDGISVTGSRIEMNGGTICDNNYRGIDLMNSSVLIMRSGSITENRSEGVWVNTGTTFTMEGGTITNNGQEGVLLDVMTVFSMSGGSISGNRTGIYAKHGITLSGNVTISGNVDSEGNPCNIKLAEGKLITIPASGLTEGAQLGITAEVPPAENTSIAITGANNADYSVFFTPDDQSCCRIQNIENVVHLYHAHIHSWTAADCINPKTCHGCGMTEGDPLGHDLEIWEAVTPTCMDSGRTREVMCRECGVLLEEGVPIEPLGHVEVIEEAKEPTCTEFGRTQGSRCSRCWEILDETFPISPLGHKEVPMKALPPTCTTAGQSEGICCETCGECLKPQEVLPAKGHSGGQATCSEAAQCETCGEFYGELLPHTFDQRIAAPEFLAGEANCMQPAKYFVSCICGKTCAETFQYGDKGDHIFVDNKCICGLLQGSCGLYGANVTWRLDLNGTLTISGNGPMANMYQNFDAYRDSITSVVIEEGISDLGDMAFSGYPNLQTVSLPSTLTQLGVNALFSCPFLHTITLAKDNPTYMARDNVLYSKDGTLLILYPSGKIDSVFTVPEGVDKICQMAFVDNQHLNQLVLPVSLRSIGNQAVYNSTNLMEVIFHGEAPTIAYDAFETANLTVRYPMFDNSWDAVKDQDYGGNLYWEPLYPDGTDGAYPWQVDFSDQRVSVDSNPYLWVSLSDEDQLISITYRIYSKETGQELVHTKYPDYSSSWYSFSFQPPTEGTFYGEVTVVNSQGNSYTAASETPLEVGNDLTIRYIRFQEDEIALGDPVEIEVETAGTGEATSVTYTFRNRKNWEVMEEITGTDLTCTYMPQKAGEYAVRVTMTNDQGFTYTSGNYYFTVYGGLWIQYIQQKVYNDSVGKPVVFSPVIAGKGSVKQIKYEILKDGVVVEDKVTTARSYLFIPSEPGEYALHVTLTDDKWYTSTYEHSFRIRDDASESEGIHSLGIHFANSEGQYMLGDTVEATVEVGGNAQITGYRFEVLEGQPYSANESVIYAVTSDIPSFRYTPQKGGTFFVRATIQTAESWPHDVTGAFTVQDPALYLDSISLSKGEVSLGEPVTITCNTVGSGKVQSVTYEFIAADTYQKTYTGQDLSFTFTPTELFNWGTAQGRDLYQCDITLRTENGAVYRDIVLFEVLAPNGIWLEQLIPTAQVVFPNTEVTFTPVVNGNGLIQSVSYQVSKAYGHNDEESFQYDTLEPFTYTFEEPGRYYVHCGINGLMSGIGATIQVTDSIGITGVSMSRNQIDLGETVDIYLQTVNFGGSVAYVEYQLVDRWTYDCIASYSGTDPYWTVKPEKGGRYYLYAKVITDDGQSSSFTSEQDLTVTDGLHITDVTCSAQTITLGESVTFTPVTAGDGSAQRVAYYMIWNRYDGGNSKKYVQDSQSFTWTPTIPGNYECFVGLTNDKGVLSYTSVNVKVLEQTLSLTELTAGTDTVTCGQPVTLAPAYTGTGNAISARYILHYAPTKDGESQIWDTAEGSTEAFTFIPERGGWWQVEALITTTSGALLQAKSAWIWAIGGECGEDLTWQLEGDTLVITGQGPMADFEAGAPWADFAGQITTAELTGGLTAIGQNAFAACVNLETICFLGDAADWNRVVQIAPVNGPLETARLSFPNHTHTARKTTVDKVLPTEAAPGYNSFTVTACSACGYWLNANGTVMTLAEREALTDKNRTYVKTASVTLLKDGAPADASLAWNLAEGWELQLDAQVLPAGAKQDITWSTSSKAIATVEDGLVTFLKPGTVTITAKGADSKSDKLTLTLSVWPEGLNITSEDTDDLRSGKSRTLTAAFTPADTTNQKVTWSVSDPAVASINSSGRLTAKTVYEQTEVTVTAVSKENPAITASYSMYILPKTDEVMSIRANNQSITAQTISCDTSDSFTLTAWTAGYPEENVTWKVNRAGASVDDTGELTFTKNGTYTITAVSADGRTAKTTFKVTTIVQSLTITSKTGAAELAEGKSLALISGVYPENASSKKVTWAITQGAEYAKVSGSGVVTASKGLTDIHTITVTATAADGSEASDSFDITLRPITTQVVIHQTSPVSLDMSKTDTLALSAHTEPYDLSRQEVVWSSSNAKVASIDADTGLVTALKPGTVTIRAVAADGSGKSASIRLTVTASVTSILLPDTISLFAGNKHSFKPTIEPANATHKTLVWSLAEGDEQFASIDPKSGKLTAKKVTEYCTVIVTAHFAEDDTIAAQTMVSIYPLATSLKIKQQDANGCTDVPGTLRLLMGQELDLVAELEPAGALSAVTWTSSSTRYVTVDEAGTLRPVRPGGTVTIKAQAADGSRKYHTIKVSVIQPMEELTLPDTLELTGGKTHTFKATVLPADTTNKGLIWSLAEEDAPFAKIDAKTGRLTTYAVTEPTTITVTASATAEENLGYSATCYVTLYPKPTAIHIRQGDTLITETITLTMEDTLLLDAWVDTNAPYLYPLVKWTSSNTRYVKVDADGTVTPVRPGATVTIKAAAKDNSRAYYSIKVRIIDAP